MSKEPCPHLQHVGLSAGGQIPEVCHIIPRDCEGSCPIRGDDSLLELGAVLQLGQAGPLLYIPHAAGLVKRGSQQQLAIIVQGAHEDAVSVACRDGRRALNNCTACLSARELQQAMVENAACRLLAACRASQVSLERIVHVLVVQAA